MQSTGGERRAGLLQPVACEQGVLVGLDDGGRREHAIGPAMLQRRRRQRHASLVEGARAAESAWRRGENTDMCSVVLQVGEVEDQLALVHNGGQREHVPKRPLVRRVALQQRLARTAGAYRLSDGGEDSGFSAGTLRREAVRREVTVVAADHVLCAEAGQLLPAAAHKDDAATQFGSMPGGKSSPPERVDQYHGRVNLAQRV
mmetsp:Transcript_7980/g.16011  ORF Transcript_7980/g.16011 Transcript_7980/m.16011 type:complete len:202 (-) Transcript_7980:104-709(-)